MKAVFDVARVFFDDSNEWYALAQYVAAAREVMNGIELDPASCELANLVIGAERYYTREQDGLQQDWTCDSLWLNPPFGTLPSGRSSMATWAARLIHAYRGGHVKQAILISMNNTEANWFQPFWDYPICFPCPRVLFHRPDGTLDHHIQGTCFVYFGTQVERFIAAFRKFGPVVTPERVHRFVQPVVQPALLRNL